MIKITVVADDHIVDVSALKLENLLKGYGLDVKRTSIVPLNTAQYDKALAR